MRLHRFIGNFNFSANTLRVADKELLNQWKKVLRLKAGSQFILSDGNLNEAVVNVKKIGKDFVELEIDAVTKNTKEAEVGTYLFCAVLKKENFELVVQKATEAGVKQIIPIITRHTVKSNLNISRLQKIAKEAAEQSGRGVVPAIHKVLSFDEALKHAKQWGVPFFFEPGALPFDPARFKRSGAKTASIFVGPEGGWDEDEAKKAKLYGSQVVGLGGLTLRSETAAIIATWIITNSR